MNTVGVKKKATSLRLDRDLYNYIEKLAKKENRSINNYIETVLSKATNFNTPNSETQIAIEEMNKEKAKLKRYSSSKELFSDLELE